MDKAEAYKVLVHEMERVADQTKEELLRMVGTSHTMKARTSSGRLLSIDVSVSNTEGEFQVRGTVHANNTHKHELLEEQIVVEK